MSRCKRPYINQIGVTLFETDYFESDKKNDNKYKVGEAHVLYMLSRTQAMFDYKDLPETVPAREIEKMVQLNGNAFFTKVDNDFYVFTGGLGGEPNVYYEPTIYTVANPALNFSKNLVIGEDGILIRNDSYMVGLLPMFKKYAALLTENEITMWISDINTRMAFLLSAADDRTKESAETFIDRIKNGKLGVISDNAFLESLKVNPTMNSNTIRLTDLIEYQQYLKAAWFNELGINANYNMKRESISPDEAQLNQDALLPFVDDMLECRRQAIKDINEKYDLNIEVTLSSSWLKEQLMQQGDTSGVDFDTDLDEHVNEFVPDNTEAEIPDEGIKEEVPEEIPEETPEEVTEGPEELKEDIEELKEEIEDIKEELEGGEDNE